MFQFPSFLIIGAAKSGTYTLHTHFGRHPDVFMCPIKEPHHFSYGNSENRGDLNGQVPVHGVVDSRQAYLKLFDGNPNATMAGESSVSYLYVPGTAERIYEFNPRMRLIVSLRNPVERAYSSFNYAKSYGIEPSETLVDGLKAEAERIRNNAPLLLRYRDLGMYGCQLTRYFDVFPRDQIKVIIYDDFVKDASRVVRELYDFVGVRPDYESDQDLRVNVTKTPDDSKLFHRIISGENLARSAVRRILPMSARRRLREYVRDVFFQPPPPMNPELRSVIGDLFRNDIQLLQQLLGRDLSFWLP